MKFSVITPSFNGMPVLRKCVGSVRAQGAAGAQRSAVSSQISDEGVKCDVLGVKPGVSNGLNPKDESFPPQADLPGAENPNTKNLTHRLVEPITVHHHIQDGGSTDGTVEFLQKFDTEVRGQRSEDGGPRTAVFAEGYAEPREDRSQQLLATRHSSLATPAYTFSYSSERDAGMYDAINKGWATADGDILSWLNADEQYLPGTLEKVASYFEAHPDVDVVFGNMIIVDRNGRPLAARREIPFRPFYVKRDFLYTASCTLFFRRTLFERGLLNFDTSYRLAGDMDLILKLAANGVKFGHINDYLSLFGTDNNNLSVKHKVLMEEEVQHIRRFYGGSNSPWVCKMAKMVRFAERVFCGCYRRDDVSFLYANNELPEHSRITADSLGFRFTYELAQKKADGNDK